MTLLLLLGGAAAAMPGMAQTAHFSGALLPVITGHAGPLAMDTSGNLYIADQQDKKVLKETPTSSGWVQTLVDGSLGGADGVAVDKNGVVYVVDIADDKVVRELPFGSIYIQESVAINLSGPQAICVDSNLNVYIAINNIDAGTSVVIKETPSGNGYVQHTVATGLSGPLGLAVNDAGDVFISDTENNRVLEEAPSGSTYTQSTVTTAVKSPIGLAFDPNGDLYVADYGNTRIVKETYFFGWQQTTVATPTLYEPGNIAFDPAGNLYINDDDNPSGSVIEMAYTGGNFYQQAISAESSYIYLLFTFDSPGKLQGGAKVLTEGVANGDFSDAGQGTCKGSTNYLTGSGCWVSVVFTPHSAGLRTGAVALVSSQGKTIATGDVYGVGQAAQIAFTPGTQHTVPYSNSGEASPYGVAVDGNGDVFISDSNNNRILKETWNGSGFTEGVVGSGLNSPGEIALDGAGNLYIADTGNNRVEEEMYSNGSYVQSDVAVGLNSPEGVAVDVSGNVYIADTFNNRILKIAVVDGNTLETVLPNLSLSHPFGIAVDGSGRVLVADTGNNRGLSVVQNPDGSISETVLDSNLSTPYGVAADAFGNAYFANYGSGTVVKETANSDGSYTYSLLPTLALMNPYALAVDNKGNVYVADVGDAQVLVQDYSDPPALNFATTAPGTTSSDSPKTVTVENIGNQTLAFESVAYPTDFPEAGNVSTDCTSSTTLGANGWCTLTIDFSPLLSSHTNPDGSMNEAIALGDNNLGGGLSGGQSLAVSGKMFLAPAMTAPASGSTLTGSSASFDWNPGIGSSQFQLLLGTAQGADDVYNGPQTTATSVFVNGIPTYGVTLYARLEYLVGSTWNHHDYTYRESGAPVKAALTTPAPGSTLAGASATFTWTAGGGVTKYSLHLGTTGVGSSNVLNGANTTALTSGMVSNIPAYGVTLYARLYSYINGAWQYNDYTYKESGTPVKAVLSAPAPGSTLTGASATFTWTAGGGVTKYEFILGTNGPGTANVYNGAYTTALSSGVISNIPAYGVTLYARLFSDINGVWQYNDYTYKESGTPVKAVLKTPTPGSTLTGSSATFTWTAGGGVTKYSLHLGTTGVGSSNVLNGANTTALTSGVVSNIPVTGAKLYARLYSYINGAWQYNDYTYTEH